MLGILTVLFLLFLIRYIFFVLCFLFDKLEDLIRSCYAVHSTYIIALLFDDKMAKSEHRREEPMPDDINFDDLLYINNFDIFLEEQSAIYDDNFFWNNNDNLVEVANECKYELHKSVIYEQYSHGKEYKMEKIKWESILIGEKYVEYYHTQCKEEQTFSKMM